MLAKTRKFLSEIAWIAPVWDALAGAKNSMRSFSQYGEDAVVQGIVNKLEVVGGFKFDRRVYVEVGACVPIRGSNSFHFSRRGWRGILVEPSPKSILSFKTWRPRDTLSICCVGRVEGTAEFYSFGQGAVFNTLSATQAEKVSAHLGIRPQKITIPVRTLDSVLAKENLTIRDVGLLFIDVEGAEMEVLRSTDLSEDGPFLIVVEILSVALATIQGHEVTEFLAKNGYVIASWCAPSVVFLRQDLFQLLQKDVPGSGK
jgi:FkbM family methyltransferase